MCKTKFCIFWERIMTWQNKYYSDITCTITIYCLLHLERINLQSLKLIVLAALESGKLERDWTPIAQLDISKNLDNNQNYRKDKIPHAWLTMVKKRMREIEFLSELNEKNTAC